MEDLWKVREMGYRLGEWVERAEYTRLVRRFHEDEERENRHHLLYADGELGRPKQD